MRKRNALAQIVVVLVFTSVMPLVMFSCSGGDPLLGFRQPQGPRPDTGQDAVTQQDGASDGGGEAGEGGMTDAPTDGTVKDTGIDTGVDTGVDAADD